MKGLYTQCVLAPLFKMFEATLELLVPSIVALLIDNGIVGGAGKGYIVKMCLLLALFAFAGLVAAVCAQYFAAKAAIGFSANIKSALMKKIGQMSYSNLDGVGTSAIITRMTNDVNQVQTGVNLTLRLLLRSPFVVFGAMIAAYLIDVKCALIFTAVIFLLCVIVFGIMLITIPMYKNVQSSLDKVTLLTRENLTGVRVIRALCAEDDEKDEFHKRNEMLSKLQRGVGRVSALLNPLTLIIINIAIVCLIYTGALQVNVGSLSQGEVFALYNYMSLILVELVKMANLIITVTRSFASGARIASVMDIDTKSEQSGKSLPSDDAEKGCVIFENVSLRYHSLEKSEDKETYSLRGISFSVKKGQTVGVIGGTGSGKTSLVNLIPAFYKASEGKVTVDGVDVNDFDKKDLRRRIALVPQKAVLFTGTIRSNLLWGNEGATDEELEYSLTVAQAKDVIKSKEKGLDEEVTQGGSNLSGGQKQRLTIARAILKKPEILIDRKSVV